MHESYLSESPSLLRLTDVPLCVLSMNICTFLIYSLVDRHLSYFHLLADMDNDAVNMGEQTLPFSPPQYVPRSEPTG